MNYKSFKLDREVFEKRMASEIQHKLRVVMRCYTIKNLLINPEEKTFSFTYTHRVNNVQMHGKKTLNGQYETFDIDDDNLMLKITVF